MDLIRIQWGLYVRIQIRGQKMNKKANILKFCICLKIVLSAFILQFVSRTVSANLSL
jgi:hypothetical protein